MSLTLVVDPGCWREFKTSPLDCSHIQFSCFPEPRLEPVNCSGIQWYFKVKRDIQWLKLICEGKMQTNLFFFKLTWFVDRSLTLVLETCSCAEQKAGSSDWLFHPWLLSTLGVSSFRESSDINRSEHLHSSKQTGRKKKKFFEQHNETRLKVDKIYCTIGNFHLKLTIYFLANGKSDP